MTPSEPALSIAPPDPIEEAGAQVIVNHFTGELEHQTSRGRMGTFNYEKARRMRRDNVISISRRVAMACVMLEQWTLEADEEWDWLKQLIEDQVMPLRAYLLRTGVGGLIDFGWKAYEKVFKFVEREQYASMADFADSVPPVLTVLGRLRALKNDFTRVRYNKWDGRFLGFSHQDQNLNHRIFIDSAHSLFINFDEEGLGEYGEGDMQMAEDHYESWHDCNDANKRFDRKVAGSLTVLHYQVGKTLMGGVEVDNGAIAAQILAAVQSSGMVALPVAKPRVEVGKEQEMVPKFKLEVISAPSQQADFVARLMYLDKQKARAMKVTERSVFEGEFGTKADADSHADAMLMVHHLRHVGFVDILNEHLVDQLCVANGGPSAEGAVKIVANELSDKNRTLMLAIFELMAADPAMAAEMLDQIDNTEVMKGLEIPLKDNNAADMSPATGGSTDDWRDELFNRDTTGITIFESDNLTIPAVGPSPWWAGLVQFSEGDDSYSCVMAMIPEGLLGAVAELQGMIDPKDVIKMEDKPHITVLYGLHTDDPQEVQNLLNDVNKARYRLYETQSFVGPKADVLYVNVYSDCLGKINSLLVGALPFTNDHGVYQPHLTLAYLKPGTAKKYEGLKGLSGAMVTTDELTFSRSDKTKTTLYLRGDGACTTAGEAL